jgi:hypothetical protein
VILGELIEPLEKLPEDRVLAVGFDKPHSYRGYYNGLAFEPARNIPVKKMLEAARSAPGNWYEGYKSGTYYMDAGTPRSRALVADPQTADVGARLDRIIDAVVRTVYAEERHIRTALRVYHDIWLRDPDSPVRKGRRMGWIDRTIAPLPAEVRESLRLALALAIGPDPVTMLKDVAGSTPSRPGAC